MNPPLAQPMADIELLPFQKEKVAELLAPGSRKLIVADLGLGTRTIMAHAASQFKDKVIIAPLALRMDWERQPTGHARFISSNTPHVIDAIRGFRLPLAMVEISSITKTKWALILELLTHMDNMWVRLVNPRDKDILLLKTYNFDMVRISSHLM